MKEIKMKLKSLPFKQIKEGSKTVEVRLLDEKRKELNVGDVIVFQNVQTGEEIKKEVVALKIFPSFAALKSASSSFNSIANTL